MSDSKHQQQAPRPNTGYEGEHRDGFGGPRASFGAHGFGEHGWGGFGHGFGEGGHGGSGGGNPPPICFMAGTSIATPGGTRPIEALAIGDLVLTADGRPAPIRWIGRQSVSMTFADPERVLPVRVRAGALDDQLPARDLLVSPNHALLVDGILVHAIALVNGTTVVREAQVPAAFIYYHVELDDHALILAEGVPAETFIDNVDREAFDNWDEHERLYPQGHPLTELPQPRAASSRQLPASLQRRLAARAAAVAGPLPAAA
jgi:hypothetical protein